MLHVAWNFERIAGTKLKHTGLELQNRFAADQGHPLRFVLIVPEIRRARSSMRKYVLKSKLTSGYDCGNELIVVVIRQRKKRMNLREHWAHYFNL